MSLAHQRAWQTRIYGKSFILSSSVLKDVESGSAFVYWWNSMLSYLTADDKVAMYYDKITLYQIMNYVKYHRTLFRVYSWCGYKISEIMCALLI